jgi:hypothetical protein
MEKRFTKQVKANGKSISFHFLKLLTNTFPRYMVTASNGMRTVPFYLEQRQEQWLMVNVEDQPLWLKNMENELEKAIEEEQKIFA